MARPRIVLASSSPRRTALLRQIGIAHTVDPATIDESIAPGTGATDAVLALAEQKASVVADRHRGLPVAVIGADTVVCIDDDILGKPGDAGEAIAMLHRLAGQTHEVHTGVCVVSHITGRTATALTTTSVTLRPIDTGQIAAYVATGEPADAAGGYAIQGRAAMFVDRIEGDYTNVVGLPLPVTVALLNDAGFDTVHAWARG